MNPEIVSVIGRAQEAGWLSRRQIRAVQDALEWVENPLRWLAQNEFLTPDQILLLSGRGSPSRIGRYRILREAGRGGMAVVHEACDETLDRKVAIKLPHPGFGDRDSIRRFRREARVLAMLRHPGIVEVYDAGEHEGRPYLVMELVSGPTLQMQIDGGKCDVAEAADYLRQAAEGVQVAHDHGILHRDLKPSNVLLAPDGRAVVTDFGLAMMADPRLGWSTEGDEFIGTPVYMSPEQVRGERDRLTARTDVWGLGATLYHAITGIPAFGGASMAEVVHRVLNEPPMEPRILNPLIDPSIERICLRALEKEPSRRYASAGALAEDLRRWQRGRERKRGGTWRRVLGWLRNAAGLSLLGMGV